MNCLISIVATSNVTSPTYVLKVSQDLVFRLWHTNWRQFSVSLYCVRGLLGTNRVACRYVQNIYDQVCSGTLYRQGRERERALICSIQIPAWGRHTLQISHGGRCAWEESAEEEDDDGCLRRRTRSCFCDSLLAACTCSSHPRHSTASSAKHSTSASNFSHTSHRIFIIFFFLNFSCLRAPCFSITL